MMKSMICLAAMIWVLSTISVRGELWVDGSTGAHGNGTADAPFATIGEAIHAAKPGDTITIRKGTYRESVAVTLSGTAERPTVLRAAPGQRVVLSGFEPIGEWKPQADGVYTATVDGPVRDLYVGLAPQPVARWPEFDQPMRRLAQPDAKANTFRDAEPLPEEPFLRDVAAAPRSAMAFLYVGFGNYYSTIPVTRLDAASGTVTLEPTRWYSNVKGKTDRYQLVNHPSLIRKPGHWAFAAAGEKRVQVYFRPARAADLEHTQYRKAPERVLMVGGYRGTVSHVRIEGLEICGSAKTGLQVNGADDIVVSRCIFHSNGGDGVATRRSNNVRIQNCISVVNGLGVSIASGENVLLEGSEIALNFIDGINVAGNVSGRPGGEPESSNITLRRNYFHHHMLMSHPDNVQLFRGVKNFTIEDNLLLFGGQGIMTEEVEGGTVRNCVVVGTGAVAVIFGHANSNGWTVEHCTVGLGGWGGFSLTGKDYRIHDNIVWNNALSIEPTLKSDYNLYFLTRTEQPVGLTGKPRWRSFLTPAEVAGALGVEQHSCRADPKFRNAPYCQAVAPQDEQSGPGRLVLRTTRDVGTAEFKENDRIEINGDGVLRRVTAVDDRAIRFDPPLPVRPFRDSLVWNWKSAASTALDLRPADGSPARTAGEGGKPVGSGLDIGAYQRGDFDGDGVRDIPELPEDLKAAIPSPNDVVIPLYGA
jgi:hypothetical protein